MRPVLALLALLVPAAAATAQTVKVDYDAKVDFSRFKTFAWSEAQEHAKNPANHIRITRATERELVAKGFQKAESGPADIRVRYYSKIEKKLKSSSRQESGTWQPNDLRTVVDVSRVDQGTLILELTDGESRAVVWRGRRSAWPPVPTWWPRSSTRRSRRSSRPTLPSPPPRRSLLLPGSPSEGGAHDVLGLSEDRLEVLGLFRLSA